MAQSIPLQYNEKYIEHILSPIQKQKKLRKIFQKLNYVLLLFVAYLLFEYSNFLQKIESEFKQIKKITGESIEYLEYNLTLGSDMKKW